MVTLTVRNVPDEVHRALRVRAALHGRGTEAEVLAILKEMTLPEGRVLFGSMLTAIGQRARLTDEEFVSFTQRDFAAGQPIDLE